MQTWIKNEELVQKVIDWGHERGFVKHENRFQQFIKLCEEQKEIVDAVISGDYEKMKLELGDAIVVEILLCEMIGIEIPNYTPNQDLLIQFTGGIGEGILKNNNGLIIANLERMNFGLLNTCEEMGTTVEEALEAAYNKISKRKGKVIDGVYVKEEDLNKTEDVKMEKMSNTNKLLQRVRDWNKAWSRFDYGDTIEKPISCDEFEVELNETFIVSRCDGQMTFGLAIEALKLGKKVARGGWNGKGMYVVLQEGSLIDPSLARGGAAKCVADAMDERELVVKKIKINSHMSIKNVDDSISTWVPSVNDCLAEDWIIID